MSADEYVDVLVPLLEFRVDYQVGVGRPFAAFETRVLQAVARGGLNHASMAEYFCVHPRLVIEALVTLTQAGLVGLSSKGLVATDRGGRELKRVAGPTARATLERRDTIFRERIRGALATRLEVKYTRMPVLKERGIWQDAKKLPRTVNSNYLDTAQVAPFLRRNRGEWIGRISRVSLARKDDSWLVARVKLSTGEIFNLPDSWLDLLAPHIGAAVGLPDKLIESSAGKWYVEIPQRREGSFVGRLETTGCRFGPTVLWPTDSPPGELITSNRDHEALLERALAESRDLVVVASGFIQASVIESILDSLESAVQRGVTVVFLWGLGASDTSSEAEAIGILNRSWARLLNSPGRLLFNRRPLGTHMKCLVWDADDGFRCCIGSYNWLSTRRRASKSNSKTTEQFTNLSNCSILSRDLRVCSYMLRSVADVFQRAGRAERGQAPGLLSKTAIRLEELLGEGGGATLEQVSGEVDSTLIGIVRDREHSRCFEEMIRSATRRILIASHKAGERISLIKAMAKKSPEVESRVLFEETTGIVDPERIRELVGNCQEQEAQVSRMHSKVVVADDLVYIGSFNPLSTDPFGRSTSSSEVGALIKARSLSEALWTLAEQRLNDRSKRPRGFSHPLK